MKWIENNAARLVCGLWLALLPLAALAQPGEQAVTALEAALPSLEGGRRAAALAELAHRLRDLDPERAITYGSEAAALLEEHPASEREIPLFLALATACFHQGDSEAQLAWAERARAAAEERGDADGRWRALLEIAEVAKQRGDFGAALENLATARRVVEELDDPAKLSQVLDRLGNTYQRQGDFSRAMESLLRALEIQRGVDEPAALAQVLRDTARVFESIDETEQALAYYQEALAITERIGDRRAAAFNRRNLANIQASPGRRHEALETSLAALAEAQALGDDKLGATLLNNIAELLSEMGRYSEALQYAERAEPALKAFGSDRYTAVVMATKAEILAQLDRHQEALAAVEESLAAAERTGRRSLLASAHEMLADVHEALDDPARALVHHRTFKELHDALFSEQSQKRMAELEARFDAAEKDRAIADLEYQRELASAELTRHKTIRNASILGSGLLLALAGVITTGYRLKRRAQRRLAATQRALAEQETEAARERAVADRLREVDRLKDEFLANTSHELRTPLFGITGLAESLIDGATGELSETTRENLSMIVAAGRRLSGLVGDILDVSRMSKKSLELERQPIDLAFLVGVVLSLSRPLVGSKDLELVNAVAADLPAADADENRLQQILHNLVGNAVKFTEAGTVEVSAVAEGERLLVRVADTGIGIDEDQQERIFEPFEQADGSAERAHGGTGLGLAVTRQLVQLHGGNLWVESRPGGGSTFSFTLPVSARPAAPPASGEGRVAGLQRPGPDAGDLLLAPVAGEAAPEPGEIESGDPEAPGAGGQEALPAGDFRILIVDDEPVIRQVLVNHLSARGYELELASSGAEALRLLEERDVDLVLLDIMMPRMSGYEVCRVLRRSRSHQVLPVIFLTAKHRVSDLETGFASGANDYLTKPISKRELVARVAVHLERLDAHRRLQRLLAEKAAWAEELEASNAELARFTYTVSHDLKSPLVTINGFLGLLEKDARSGQFERMEHDLRRIRGATARMQQLLGDLLELSRIGRMTNEPEEVDLRTVACEALAMVAGQVADRGAEVTIVPDLPVATGDRVRLIQVYQNLLENAVKYMGDQASPRVEVGWLQDAEETVLVVRDNGMGIDPRYHRKIFGLFERLKAETPGTGVGLALVQRIVEVHGGRVWVESEGKGQGATFCFTLQGE